MKETRTPPQNLEAEQAVIGAVLIDNAQFEPVAEIIERDDFYREAHKIMWEAMGALAAARRSIDAITLAEALRPHVAEIPSGYIAECAANVPAPSLSCDYARMVREKAVQRRLVTAATEIAAQGYESPAPWSPDWTEELIANAEYEIAEIASRMERAPEPPKATRLSTVLWKLEHGEVDSVATGFPHLDRSFGGFPVGHITMLAARTSRGKTALATNFALNAAKRGESVAFFTLEMTADEMWVRTLSLEARVDMFRARRMGFRDDERELVHQARETLATLPLEILYRPSMRPRDLRIECRRLARQLGTLKLVVVDYLGLMRGDRREKERWREMQEVVLSLKAIAGELAVPILLLSQLNRETNEDHPPTLANLRDTGATEEHASNVLFVWQPPRERNAAPVYDDWEEVEIHVAKQRNGPVGVAQMQFRKNWGAFIEG